MPSRNSKFSVSIAKFTQQINNFAELPKDPEFIRYIAHEIAKITVELAKNNIKNADQLYQEHSIWTESMTERFSKGARKTKDVLYETGKMHDSIKILSSTVSYGKVVVEVGIKNPDIARIAQILEYGTVFSLKNGTIVRIPKRPFLHPAARESIDVAFESTNLLEVINLAIEAKMAGKDWKKHFKQVKAY